ncbi:hypothetical protein [Alteromonas sp. P256]|uniref:hypothetical protein n=1 Tax=Alteromonas sp. P256 TaxID=3117399 RepID=UPI002FE3CBD2
MIPRAIAMICVFLPFIAVHTTLLIGIFVGNLEPCNPYWSSCHSISATGRQYPEFFVFKALLIPTAVLMSAYWLLLYQWVQQVTEGAYKAKPLVLMGIIASIALVIYTVTLGAEGNAYGLARRIGVIFYFAFSAFAHLLLLGYVDKVDTHHLNIVTEQNRLSISATILIVTAIFSAIVGYVFPEFWDEWENAYEWWFSLLMISMFYQVGSMWKKTQFSLSLSISPHI